ncbi:hypothetical protein ANCCAN_30030 [Ancylostoma caninum]|uniref:Uncharacterized protein n=1 Tax=Ancylostoma caninum TaxID=29170 RepID=A0A368EY57_ANCCA|nr:hypothetical protein ANCCAN_30030 [Ancylostoma caninum]
MNVYAQNKVHTSVFFNFQGVVTDEKAGGRPFRRHRQNVSKTDFEQLCNVIFSSDEEPNDGIRGGPSTSVSYAHTSDVEEDYVQLRPTSITSLSIDQFVNEDRQEIVR